MAKEAQCIVLNYKCKNVVIFKKVVKAKHDVYYKTIEAGSAVVVFADGSPPLTAPGLVTMGSILYRSTVLSEFPGLVFTFLGSFSLEYPNRGKYRYASTPCPSILNRVNSPPKYLA
jgi:hypothetical protein